MSNKLSKILGILLSISIIVAGLCLMIQCLSIYNSGDKPYSRDAVAQAFGEISLPVYVCISLVAVTFVYGLFIDASPAKNGVTKNAAFAIKAITQKRETECNGEIRKERRTRRIRYVILAILLVCGFGCFFVYALNPANYHQSEINASMIKAMTVFCVCIILPFAYSIVCVYLNEKSRQRELKVIRSMIKELPSKEPDLKNENKNTPFALIVKTASLILCAGIILYGLFSGGTADVLTKAINICTECIGLG